MKREYKTTFWYGFNVTALILIIGFLLLVPVVRAIQFIAGTVDVVMHASKDTDSFTSFTVDILNTSKSALNAAEFEIQYDPKALLITEIVPHSTLCEDRFIINNSINADTGTLLFQCGTVTPYANATGTLATIYGKKLRPGTTSLQFGAATHVLAHDGFGTDLTGNKEGLTF